MWHVLVPAHAASRCLDSSRLGTYSESFPPSVYLAAIVPSQPAYLNNGKDDS
jgi:hypothetical protein